MTMGETGMDGMAEMGMPIPDGSTSMLGGDGPHGHIDMGGMFTILKIRERLPREGDSGWYRNPPGTVAVEATADELRRDGRQRVGSNARSARIGDLSVGSGGLWTRRVWAQT